MIRQFAGLFSIFLSVICTAQNPLDQDVIDDGVRAVFKAAQQKNIATYKDRSRYFVRTGIVADKETRKVRILAVATGNKGDVPLEYVLVGENGKHYESLASTLAKPSDIHAAMEFVGMKAGYTIRPASYLLWSKGDEVDVTIGWKQGENNLSYPIQKLLKYPETNTFITQGWIFTGTFAIPRRGKTLYAADDAGDIISTFNSSWTVFDVAELAGQKEVYGSIMPSKLYTADFQQELELEITPKLPLGKTRNIDLKLELNPPEGKVVEKGDDIVFRLIRKDDDTILVNSGSFKQVLEALSPFIKGQKKKVYAELHYSQALPIGPLSEVLAVISQITNRNLLRIEPVSGQIFFQAFTPAPSWKEPRSRPVQPLEIFLSSDDKTPHTFRYYDEDFLPTGQLKLSEIKKSFRTGEELNAILKTKDDWVSQVILFYASPTTPLSEISAFYSQHAKVYPMAFVFANTE